MVIDEKEYILFQLSEINPWWRAPYRIQNRMLDVEPRPYLNLFYPHVVSDIKNNNFAVILMGPRRVGKTWLINHTIQKLIDDGVNPKNILYASHDNPYLSFLPPDVILEYYKEVTGIDYRKEKVFAFFDEIQYLKDWERFIKVLVDNYPKLKIVASGSAAAALKRKSEESGAGRFRDFLLPPLSFYEYLLLIGEVEPFKVVPSLGKNALVQLPEKYHKKNYNKHLVDYINYGGFPQTISIDKDNETDIKLVLQDAVDKVLMKDLPSIYGISNPLELDSFFTRLAIRTGEQTSYENLSQDTKIDKQQVKKYLEYLEAAFLIKIVDKVNLDAKNYQRRSNFKIYLTNSAVRTAKYKPITENDPFMSNMIETALFAQHFHNPKKQVYYMRDGNKEIDIVTRDYDFKVSSATEIKWSDRVATHYEDIENLIKFAHKHNLLFAKVTTKTTNKVDFIQSVMTHFIPAAVEILAQGMITIGLMEAGEFAKQMDINKNSDPA